MQNRNLKHCPMSGTQNGLVPDSVVRNARDTWRLHAMCLLQLLLCKVSLDFDMTMTCCCTCDIDHMSTPLLKVVSNLSSAT